MAVYGNRDGSVSSCIRWSCFGDFATNGFGKTDVIVGCDLPDLRARRGWYQQLQADVTPGRMTYPGPRPAGMGSGRIFLRKADGTALPRVQRIRFGGNAGFELGGEMSSIAFHQSDFGVIRPSQTSQSFNKPLAPFSGTTSPYRREDKPCTLIVLRQCGASCEHMMDRILGCPDHYGLWQSCLSTEIHSQHVIVKIAKDHPFFPLLQPLVSQAV